MTPRISIFAACLAAAVALAACGSSDDGGATKPTSMAVTVSQSGKTATYQVAKSARGGLVKLVVRNQAKQPRSAQLVLYSGNHTAQEAVKTVSSDSPKTPDWVRGAGGLGPIGPGQTQNATLNLPEGKYLLGDFTGDNQGTPPYTTLTVTKGDKGDLPKTSATIAAAEAGKDKYKWEIDGDLKTGPNDVTFDSKGKEALHFIGAFRVTGDPSLSQVEKALASQGGPPPKFVDPTSFTNTAVLDGGLSQTTPLNLKSPGTYVLFCPLTDRDGGKPHFEEGLLKKVQVK